MKLEKVIGVELAFYKKAGKEAVTTSRVLANHFNKRHKNLLSKITMLKKNDNKTFTELNIKLSAYTDPSGKKNKEYILNRDAYSFFAMGFTGKNANKFKIDFIKSFNAMETWIIHRVQNSLEHKVMADTLLETRTLAGKDTRNHHYSNEARLVNWAITGKFGKLDRASLSKDELDMLYSLQKRNAVLIGAGMSYADRKEALKLFAELNDMGGV